MKISPGLKQLREKLVYNSQSSKHSLVIRSLLLFHRVMIDRYLATTKVDTLMRDNYFSHAGDNTYERMAILVMMR